MKRPPKISLDDPALDAWLNGPSDQEILARWFSTGFGHIGFLGYDSIDSPLLPRIGDRLASAVLNQQSDESQMKLFLSSYPFYLHDLDFSKRFYRLGVLDAALSNPSFNELLEAHRTPERDALLLKAWHDVGSKMNSLDMAWDKISERCHRPYLTEMTLRAFLSQYPPTSPLYHSALDSFLMATPRYPGLKDEVRERIALSRREQLQAFAQDACEDEVDGVSMQRPRPKI